VHNKCRKCSDTTNKKKMSEVFRHNKYIWRYTYTNTLTQVTKRRTNRHISQIHMEIHTHEQTQCAVYVYFNIYIDTHRLPNVAQIDTSHKIHVV